MKPNAPAHAWAEHDMRHFRFVRQLDHLNGAAIEIYEPAPALRWIVVIVAITLSVLAMVLV